MSNEDMNVTINTNLVGAGNIVVDVRGSLCPTPVIETKKAMEGQPKAVFTTIVDNEVSRDNVAKFGQSRHCKVTIVEDGKDFYITLTPETAIDTTAVGEGVTLVETPATMAMLDTPERAGGKVLLVTKDYLGEGNQELGRTLMKTFWFCLTEADVKPAKVFFINSGVKMVTEGSEHIENLQKLADAGVEIAACGICLDFYGMKEKVAVGSITNLYAITDAMMTESMVIL
ncbi:sulfurtransferase-like selenium metabolism protein YedF [Veillonella intestinalis]|uniref:sulfurtransferase-like selenium metabolism protein YedF n=1 Tax=Veillonella intestinalis TaxID=2941341 RepID=UPI00203BBDC1|nr:sulfurtransferase-like selenium metabolism protein YedF [Veillonella intestinalis]